MEMTTKEIEDARDEIREKLDAIVDQHTEDGDAVVEAMTDIYNICNGSDERNWRDCMERIQDIARQFI